MVALVVALSGAPSAAASLEYLNATSMSLGVVDEVAATFQAGSSAATVAVGANATSLDVTMLTEHVPDLGAVSASTGSCVGCTEANMETNDDAFAVVTSCCLITQVAVLQVFTDPPSAPWATAGGPIVVTYSGKASAVITQTLQVFNFTSSAWDAEQTAAFSDETLLTGSNGDGSHWASPVDGHVRVRVAGASEVASYTISGDWIEVRYATSNATATWTALGSVSAAASETTDLTVSGDSVGIVNAGRLTTVDVLLGALDTRILRIENGVVTESGSASVTVAPGASVELDMVVTATHGSVSSWDFQLVLSQGGLQVRYPVAWTLEAT